MQNLFADMGSPDFTKMNNMGQQARTDESITAKMSDAMVDNSKMAGAAKVAIADAQADAIEAQGQAAMQGAMGSAIGQIGGMFGSVVGGMGGGTTAPATTSFSTPAPGGYTVGAAATPKFRNFNMFGGR